MNPITLLTQPDCPLCDHAKRVLARIGHDIPITVAEMDMKGDDGRALATTAGVMFAPGVLLDGTLFSYGRLSERKLRKALATRTNHGPQPA